MVSMARWFKYHVRGYQEELGRVVRGPSEDNFFITYCILFQKVAWIGLIYWRGSGLWMTVLNWEQHKNIPDIQKILTKLIQWNFFNEPDLQNHDILTVLTKCSIMMWFFDHTVISKKKVLNINHFVSCH